MKIKQINWKFLLIGGLMGISQQLLGRVDYYLYHGRNIFSFSAIMGGLSLYATIILCIIFRDQRPKQQFIDLFVFFLGLDFFYYLYIFIKDLIGYFSSGGTDYEMAFYFQNTFEECIDFLKWTIIATSAGLWALFATKLRKSNKMKCYFAMLIPLYIVIIHEVILYADTLFHYVMQEMNKSENSENLSGFFYRCTISEFLTALVSFIISIGLLRKHYKKIKRI